MSGNDAAEADWIDQLVFGAAAAGTGTSGTVQARQITVGGTAINNFSDFFLVTPDGGGGSALTLVSEPSSLALLALGGLAFARRRRQVISCFFANKAFPFIGEIFFISHCNACLHKKNRISLLVIRLLNS